MGITCFRSSEHLRLPWTGRFRFSCDSPLVCVDSATTYPLLNYLEQHPPAHRPADVKILDRASYEMT